MTYPIAYALGISIAGEMKLSDSLGSTGVYSSLSECFDAILSNPVSTVPDSQLLRVVWDLDETVSIFLALLSPLATKHLRDSRKVSLNGWSIYYIPGKIFSLRRDGTGNPEATLYGLNQFFPDVDLPNLDAAGVLWWAGHLLQCLEKDFGIPPGAVRKLISPVSVAEEHLFQSLDIPTMADVPPEAVECVNYALDCDNRLWQSNYQIGHWPTGECHMYDRSSAFPATAANLIDFRGAEFIYSREDLRYEADINYGFLKGKVTIDKGALSYLSPVLARLSDGSWTSSVGTWPDTLTLDMVHYITAKHLGKFEMKDGWFIRLPRGKTDCPLRALMRTLYEKRRQSHFADFFAKKAMNGIIGKMIESYVQPDGSVKYGRWFNPIWHALLTTDIAIRNTEFMLAHGIQEQELVAVRVDGLLTTRKPIGFNELPVSSLGAWRYDGARAVFVLSPNQVWFEDGKTYPKLMRQIEEHPLSKSYDAVDLNALHLSQNRVFDKLPRTGQSLLNSRFQSRPVEDR